MRRHGAAVPFVLTTLALDAIGIGLVIPIMPALVRLLSGLSADRAAFWVGTAVAIYAGAQFLAAPVLGALSDRYGRRTVILISVGGIACNYLLLAFAPSLPWLFLGRAIAGATGASASAANAYIADVSPPGERARRFALVSAVFGGAFIIGPAMGGALGAMDLRLPFFAAAGLAATNFAFGLFVLPESLPQSLRRPFRWQQANPVGSIGALTASATGIRLAFAWCVMWFSIGTLQTVFVLYTGVRLGWGPAQNGAALALVGAAQVFTQTVVVRQVVRRFGERRVATTCLLASVASYAMFAAADRPLVLYAAILVQAFGSMASPTVRALLSAATPADRQGRLAGGMASVEGLTAIAAPVIASTLFSIFAAPGAAVHLPGAPFLVAACLFAAASVAVWRSKADVRTTQDVARSAAVAAEDKP
jgi:DHA1 family tetracycline resistance protein-like MFS transporter